MGYPSPKFGSRQDFEKAKIELEWIRSRKRKLKTKDFEEVSSKYDFPIEFLKKGIKGLDLNDYLISRSEWFPIIYSWVVQGEEAGKKFTKLCMDYVRSKYLRKRFVFYMLILLGYFSWYFLAILNKTVEETFTFIFPILLFSFEIFLALNFRMSEKKANRDEFAGQMRHRGMGQEVESTMKFVDKGWIAAVFRPNKILKAPLWTLFPLEKLKGEDFETLKQVMSQKKSTHPTFFGEKPHQAYEERIRQLIEKKTDD